MSDLRREVFLAATAITASVVLFESTASADIVGLRIGSGVIETYAIDAATGAAAPLPFSSFPIVGGWGDRMVAVDGPRDRMYVVTDPSGTAPSNLYTIQASTGELLSGQALGGAAPERLDALAVRSDGTLIGLRPNFGSGVMETYVVDPVTGIASALPTGSFAFSGGWGDGMFAIDETANRYYVGADPSGSGPATLYSLDLTTGDLLSTLSLSGSAPVRLDNMFARSDGSLFGLRTVFGATNSVESYSIDPSTAAATAIGSFSFTGSWSEGMATLSESDGVFHVASDPAGSSPANFFTASLALGSLQSAQDVGASGPERLDAILHYTIPEPGTLTVFVLGLLSLQAFGLFSRTRQRERPQSNLTSSLDSPS